MFQRHGIFRPLGTPEPEMVRVPGLRNVALTPPYFHDGSAATLPGAVKAMALRSSTACWPMIRSPPLSPFSIRSPALIRDSWSRPPPLR